MIIAKWFSSSVLAQCDTLSAGSSWPEQDFFFSHWFHFRVPGESPRLGSLQVWKVPASALGAKLCVCVMVIKTRPTSFFLWSLRLLESLTQLEYFRKCGYFTGWDVSWKAHIPGCLWTCPLPLAGWEAPWFEVESVDPFLSPETWGLKVDGFFQEVFDW